MIYIMEFTKIIITTINAGDMDNLIILVAFKVYPCAVKVWMRINYNLLFKHKIFP